MDDKDKVGKYVSILIPSYNIVIILLCVRISYTPLLSCHAVNMVTFNSRIRKSASGQLLDS